MATKRTAKRLKLYELPNKGMWENSALQFTLPKEELGLRPFGESRVIKGFLKRPENFFKEKRGFYRFPQKVIWDTHIGFLGDN